MANRMKEDEKNEKIIRGLLKLSANRRCINCNSLGPQYVCTNFWTFVCTTCSGIHREFTHRVKSVSMAKFTPQEVSALQEGGNEQARQTYFKEWDPQRHFVPDSSNVEGLRDFIRHVYVDKRYTGERSFDRPPRIKGDREDYKDNRRTDGYHGGSGSPQDEDTYERRYYEQSGPGGRNDERNYKYYHDERRSPRYDQESVRYGGYRRSPAHSEVVDKRHKDERFENGNQQRRFEDSKFPDGASHPGGRSPNRQTDMDISNPPVVRPVRDILGEDTPPLRVGDPPKANVSRSTDGSALKQRTASSSSLEFTDRNMVEIKWVNLGSLIDFTADTGPSVAPALLDPFSGQSTSQSTTNPSSEGSNWASFDCTIQEKKSQTPATTLESALLQVSAPAVAPVDSMSTSSIGGVDPFIKSTEGGQWPSSFTGIDSWTTVKQYLPHLTGASSNQPWNSLLMPNSQGPLITQPGQPAQAGMILPQEISTGVALQPPAKEKPTGRKELPEDLFTLTYAPAPVPVVGWQTSAHHGMGYGIQYPAAELQPMPVLPHSSKSTNPFDPRNETTPVHAQMFPSMESLHGALPTIGVSPALTHTSSFGTISPRSMPARVPSYPPVVPSGAYMVLQAPSSMRPLRSQRSGGFGSDRAPFRTLGGDQQSGRYSQLTASSSFSSDGGNPFG